MEQAQTKKRDIFEWIGVCVDIVQAIVFVTAILGALYWYANSGRGLAAVVVAIAVANLVCILALLMKRGGR